MANLRLNAVCILSIVSFMLIHSEFSFAADWFEVNAGLATSDIRVLAVDPLDERFVYAGTATGVYKSTNSGMEWSNLGLKHVVSFVIDFVNPNTLYAGTESVTVMGAWNFGDRVLFKSTDGGRTWSNKTSPSDYDFSLLVMDPTEPRTLYVGSFGRLIGADDVFLRKTLNGGETWILKQAANIGLRCCSLAIDSNDPSVLYASGDLYQRQMPIDSGVLKSTDGGATWTATALTNSQTPLPDRYWVNLIAMDPHNPSILYAAADRSYSEAAGLFKSTDAGKTWSSVYSGLVQLGSTRPITAIVIDPDNTNVIYAGTRGDGVFKTADGGKHWSAFNDGLSNLDIRALTLTENPNVLYAGTSGGIFKTLDDELILTLDANTYCVGSTWRLTLSNSQPLESVRLMGTSNGQSWEIADWRQTNGVGTWTEPGVFATGSEGTHFLRAKIGELLSPVVSFIISNCGP